MPQLTKQQIDVIAAECLETRPEPKITLPYKHCEDGAYDEQSSLSRKFVYGGFNYLIATKMWVDDQVANKRLPEWMQAPWGTYPDTPPKPPKK